MRAKTTFLAKCSMEKKCKGMIKSISGSRFMLVLISYTSNMLWVAIDPTKDLAKNGVWPIFVVFLPKIEILKGQNLG